MQQSKMNQEAATLAMAASAVDRTRELIEDGWKKGALNDGVKGVETFCVHGALNTALSEMFGREEECGRVNVCGGYAATSQGFGPVEAVATAILVDEASAQFGYDADTWKSGQMGVALWNDDAERTHEQVLSILAGASKRLWAMSEDMGGEEQVSYAETEEPVTQQVHAYA